MDKTEITTEVIINPDEMKQENPNMVYGRLAESVHISGYSLERAMSEFEYLLENDRWKAVGRGYKDINEFVRSLSFKEFKIAVEQRKKIAARLKELEASQRATAEMLGVNVSTVNRDVVANATEDDNIHTDTQEDTNHTVANATPEPEEEAPLFSKGANEVIDTVEKTEKKAHEKEEKKRQREDEIKRQREDIETGKAVLPEGVFEVVVIDPPWAYGREYDPETSRVANPYPEMSQQELLQLEPPFANDSVLFLWTTHAFIWDAKELMDKWGFTYKATMVWNKEKIGMGAWLRMQCEFCLIGIKGKPVWNNTKWRDIITEPRREHSRKPEMFYAMVDDITVGRKLDYFSREARQGWDTFGNDVNKF